MPKVQLHQWRSLRQRSERQNCGLLRLNLFRTDCLPSKWSPRGFRLIVYSVCEANCALNCRDYFPLTVSNLMR